MTEDQAAELLILVKVGLALAAFTIAWFAYADILKTYRRK